MANNLSTLSNAIDLFDSVKATNGDRTNRKIVNLLGSEDFLVAVFRPTINGRVSQSEVSAKITELYDTVGRARVALGIANALSDYGVRSLKRTSAVFLVTMVNLGMTTINEKATELGIQRDHDNISEENYQSILRKLSRYQDALGELLDYAKDIIQGDAKVLARETGLPKKVCQSALYTVPSPDYMDQYKIGYYLNTLLSNLYGYIDITDTPIEDYDEIEWFRFFRKVFGASRVPDVASLILLEGKTRLEKYENHPRDVVDCWDSLTQFALKGLNQSPDTIRDQMVELYLKRINKMLSNHDIDFRIDLRTIDSLRFENLASTVNKYRTKLEDIMTKASALANATPNTSPVV